MPDESSVKWSLTDDGVLTISGTGAIREYGWSNYPWNDYKENDIKSVVIGEGVTNIPGQAFWCTRKMTSVSIPASVTTIGDMAFTECGIESGTNLVVTIADGSSLASIGGEAFRESKLASITIPASVTTLSPWAFYGCENLTAITVEDGNANYSSDGGVLYSKDKSELILYPAGKTDTSFEIPATVTAISGATFSGCTSITAFTVAAGNTAFSAEDGVLFNIDKTTLVKYPAGKAGTSYEILASVTTIGETAFAQCANLTSVTIGNNVTTIGTDAFAECGNLTSVTIGNSVESLGMGAFASCTSLATVDFGSNVKITTIANDVFANCLALTSISLPAGVTRIVEYAFFRCNALATVTLNSNPYIDTDAFMGISPAPQVTMNLTANPAGGANWMTFCSTYGNFQADANTQVFKAELSNTGALTLHEVTDKIVDKGQGVILKSTGNPMMTQTMSDSLNPETNNLFGVDQFEGFDIGGSCAYVLNNGSQGVGFYLLAAGKTLGYGKAFLRFTGGSTAPSFLGFSETTGINAVNGSEFMVNGSDVYNLKGQRVAQPTKGLYIVNGKKFVIK